jgi:pimeloyl-ACP methyl ester carboxylesterase
MAHKFDMSRDTASLDRPVVRERILTYGSSTPLTGVFTYHPQHYQRRTPCVVILNAGVVRKCGPNNLNAFLARQIAQQGLGVFRFDFAGVGDSPNRQDGLPLREGVLRDVAESLDELEAVLGARRFVLVGLCSGADNGLRAARIEADRVVGLAMMDPTVFRTRKWLLVKLAKRLAAPEFWKSVLRLRHPRMRAFVDSLGSSSDCGMECVPAVEIPELYKVGLKKRDEIEACLREVRERGVSLCFAFTGSWADLYNYRTQLYDVYPKLGLKKDVELLYYPESSHTLSFHEHRRALASDLSRWLDRFLVPEAAPDS